MPNPLIVFPYPSQITAGQPLDANAVQQDFVQVASAFNAHTHTAAEVSGLPAGASGGGDVWLPGEMKTFPGLYIPSVVGCIFPCLGATLWVASVHAYCASAVGCWHGGNASILKLPDMGGRMFVGVATGGHVDVQIPGNNEGALLANRRPKHQHTVYDPTHTHGITVTNAGQVTIAGGGGGGSATDATEGKSSSTTFAIAAASTGIKINPEGAVSSSAPQDAPAYNVGGWFIRVL